MAALSRLYFMTTTCFGAGALARLPATLAEAGIARPMLVADRGVEAAGLLARLLDALGREPAAIFLDTPANPTEAAAEAAARIYAGAQADGLLALGGGSAIDLAKAVAILGPGHGPLAAYEFVRPGGPAPLPATVAPLVAVPTTAGTGSEVGRATVISTAEDRKLIVVDPKLLPRATLADPTLAASLPPALTAGSGMDAFAHCVEGFLAPNYNPPARAVALDGARRIFRALPRAVADGADEEARADMTMASLEGGMAMANGLGAVHAASHAVGGIHRLKAHHGTLNAILLPHVIRFNTEAGHADAAPLAEALGLAPADLPDAVARLCEAIGLPTRLSAMGVTADMVPALAERAAADFTARTNPRPAGTAEYERLIREAL